MVKQKVKPRFRRKSLWRRLVTPRRIAALGILSVLSLGVFTYYYIKYSLIIDAKLNGDVLIRTSGIYANPRVIRTGQNLSLSEVRQMLDAAGYVEAGKGGDTSRGRYSITGTTLGVEPGQTAIVDGTPLFPAVNITFSRSGETIVRLTERGSNRALQSTELEPELIASLSNSEHEKRKIVQYEDIPPNLVNAIVAIEDRRFFEHKGIDYRGLARAVWINVTNREVQQGGSTLTQQLIKNMFLTPEKTYRRKLQEAFMAVVLETRLSKERIFQLYANEIFLGQQGTYSINGVGEAAQAYFNKDVTSLNLQQSAFLAGIIRGPSLYSPYAHIDRAKERRDQVIDAMVETGAIPQTEADVAKQTDLGVQSRRALANANAPYFVDYLQDELNKAFKDDLSRQALRIYSSVDLDLQRAAEQALRNNLADLDQIFAKRKVDPLPPGTLQAALVAVDVHTGEIVAMVGGRDYEQSQLNRVVNAHRQPGSVFKPIVYAAALDTAFSGATSPPITAVSPFLDAPEKFTYGNGQVYEPGNYGDRYSNRDVPLREGLVRSLNVVTVRVAEKIGLFQVQQMATRLGLPKPPPFPATALGTTEATPLEVAGAYTAFANLGTRVTPTGLRRVTNAEGTTVRPLIPAPFPAMQPPVAYITTDLMKDVLNRGTAAGARSRGFTALAAGKTGTSRDGWFAGYTPNLVCIVWVGFDDNSQLGLEGAKTALPIWTDFMKVALRLRPDLAGDEFPKPPSGVVEADVDPESGELATPACPSHRKELFVEGTQPTEPCALHGGSTTDVIPDEDDDDDDDVDDYSIPPYKQPPKPESPPPPPSASLKKALQSSSSSERPRRVSAPNDKSP
jgi:penicillin-binding protein 1B